MTERKSLTKKTRFEVFKRDSFTCQYCGKKSPDVVLEVDHITPVSKGGKNEIMNLVTACFDCNRGKSNIKLKDSSVIEKQRAQIEELNLRRQQLEMLLEWRTGLQTIKDDEACKISEFISTLTNDKESLSEFGLKNMRKHIKKFGLQEIFDATEIAFDKYYFGDNESCNIAIKKIPAIAFMNTQPEYKKQISYIKGILRNRVYCNDAVCTQILEQFHQLNGNMKSVINLAKNVRNWTEFKEAVEEYNERHSNEDQIF